MNKRRHTKIVREGQYIAEVEVELIDSGESWSPYLSLEDAYKLDDVRVALRFGDLNPRKAEPLCGFRRMEPGTIPDRSARC